MMCLINLYFYCNHSDFGPLILNSIIITNILISSFTVLLGHYHCILLFVYWCVSTLDTVAY